MSTMLQLLLWVLLAGLQWTGILQKLWSCYVLICGHSGKKWKADVLNSHKKTWRISQHNSLTVYKPWICQVLQDIFLVHLQCVEMFYFHYAEEETVIIIYLFGCLQPLKNPWPSTSLEQVGIWTSTGFCFSIRVFLLNEWNELYYYPNRSIICSVPKENPRGNMNVKAIPDNFEWLILSLSPSLSLETETWLIFLFKMWWQVWRFLIRWRWIG